MNVNQWISRHKVTLIFTVAAILLAAAITVVVAQSFWNPTNHLEGTPAEPTPTPTATPTVDVVGGVLTGNTTNLHVGDTLRLTVTLNVTQPDVPVRLFNHGNQIAETVTDTDGIAVFDRTVTMPYDYHAEIYNE